MRIWGIRGVLALFFLSTAGLKFAALDTPPDPRGGGVGFAGMNSPWLLGSVAAIEALLGAALFSHFWRSSLFVCLAVLAAFWALALKRILSGDGASCGCFGSVEVDSWVHLSLIIGMFALGLSLVLPAGNPPPGQGADC